MAAKDISIIESMKEEEADDFSAASDLVSINFAGKDQLKSVPGIGDKVANAILSVRESSGNISEQVLHLLTRGSLTTESLQMLDFTLNKDLAPTMPIGKLALETPKGSKGSTVPHPPGSVSAILDTIKQHLSPPKPVKPELVSPPAQVSVPVAEWKKLMEMVKLVQTSKGASPGTPEESDAESLPAVPTGTPGNVTDDVTPKRSVGSLQGTRLQFSETSTSNADSSDEESYCSAVSRQQNKPHRRKRVSADQWRRTNDIIKHFPKGLYYDGKGNWEAFRQKFKQCASALEWTTDECFTALAWSLTGKASEYYAVLGDQKGLTNQGLLKKLEHRFGARELPATAQARFLQSTQSKGESLEDWADRVMTLAVRAFRELPESYSVQQAITRFCQGLIDKEVASQVSSKVPTTMEEAINNAKWCQHVHQAVYGNKVDRSKQSESDSEESYRVMPINKRQQESAAQNSSTSNPVLSSVEKMLADFRLEIGQKLDRVNATVSKPVRPSSSGNSESQRYKGRRNRRRGPPGRAPPDLVCFACGGLGHYARDCENRPSPNNQKENPLNSRGSGAAAKPRPN